MNDYLKGFNNKGNKFKKQEIRDMIQKNEVITYLEENMKMQDYSTFSGLNLQESNQMSPQSNEDLEMNVESILNGENRNVEFHPGDYGDL